MNKLLNKIKNLEKLVEPVVRLTLRVFKVVCIVVGFLYLVHLLALATI